MSTKTTKQPRGLQVAVIGSGVAGLCLAKCLGKVRAPVDYTVTCFEKSYRPGGRLATRVMTPLGQGVYDHKTLQDFIYFDTGAQNLNLQTFTESELIAVGINPEFLMPFTLEQDTTSPSFFVAVPNAAHLADHMAQGIVLEVNAKITAIVPEPSGKWSCVREGGETIYGFDVLVLNMPAPQACELMIESLTSVQLAKLPPGRPSRLAAVRDAWLTELRAVRFDPCFSLTLARSQRLPNISSFFDATSTSCMFRSIVCENDKPGRQFENFSYTIHANSHFSQHELSRDTNDVLQLMVEGLNRLTGESIDEFNRLKIFAKVQRWRYALAAHPLARGFFWDPAFGFGICGDWCLGSRLEHAIVSGRSLADEIVRTFQDWGDSEK